MSYTMYYDVSLWSTAKIYVFPFCEYPLSMTKKVLIFFLAPFDPQLDMLWDSDHSQTFSHPFNIYQQSWLRYVTVSCLPETLLGQWEWLGGWKKNDFHEDPVVSMDFGFQLKARQNEGIWLIEKKNKISTFKIYLRIWCSILAWGRLTAVKNK